jgi:uncharacterized protein (DUF3084 family)
MALNYDFDHAEATARTFRRAAESVIRNLKSIEQKRADLKQQFESIKTVEEEKRELESELEKIDSSPLVKLKKDRETMMQGPREEAEAHWEIKKKKEKEIKEQERKLRNLLKIYETDRKALLNTERDHARIHTLENALYVQNRRFKRSKYY